MASTYPSDCEYVYILIRIKFTEENLLLVHCFATMVRRMMFILLGAWLAWTRLPSLPTYDTYVS